MPLIRQCVAEPVVVVRPFVKCDLEVVSVFSRRPALRRAAGVLSRNRHLARLSSHSGLQAKPMPNPKARISVWYTGENERPRVDIWTRTWSFDPNSKVVGNWYFPIWWLQFPELVQHNSIDLPAENRTGVEISLRDACAPRRLHVKSRKLHCCAFLNRSTNGRDALLRALNEVNPVDIFGRLSGHVVREKKDVALEYRLMFCGENNLYPGYVTEKIFDAWSLGCVPIWSGIDREGYLNPNAFINAADFVDTGEFIEAVRTLDSSGDLRTAMVNEPILKSVPDVRPILDDLRELLDS